MGFTAFQFHSFILALFFTLKTLIYRFPNDPCEIPLSKRGKERKGWSLRPLQLKYRSKAITCCPCDNTDEECREIVLETAVAMIKQAKMECKK